MKNKLFHLLTIIIILGVNQNILAQNRNIEVTSTRNADKSVDINYTKKLPGSYYVRVEFTSLNNCHQPDFETLIKNSSGTLIRLKPLNSNQPINYSYKFSSILGDPNAKVDENFIYVIPFKIGKTVKIKESTNLKETYFNADKDENWKSYIVDRVAADTIYSMRKGIVIERIDEFKTDSLDAYRYTSKMNRITIEHNDGTISRYIGFNKKSMFVKLGQTVYPQTKLGVLDFFNNSNYRLYFDVARLKKVDFNAMNKRTLSSEGLREHITPYFYRSDKPINLNKNSDNLVEIDDATHFKEFTKKELKNYKKNPQLFE